MEYDLEGMILIKSCKKIPKREVKAIRAESARRVPSHRCQHEMKGEITRELIEHLTPAQS